MRTNRLLAGTGCLTSRACTQLAAPPPWHSQIQCCPKQPTVSQRLSGSALHRSRFFVSSDLIDPQTAAAVRVSSLRDTAAEHSSHALEGVGDVWVSVLGDAGDGKVDDGRGESGMGVGVVAAGVRPKSHELIEPEHEAETINSGLHIVLSFDEAQKFQAVEGVAGNQLAPKASHYFAIDGVIETIIIPVAQSAAAVLAETVLGEPAVETTSQQSYQHPRWGAGGYDLEIAYPFLGPVFALPPIATVVVLQVPGEVVLQPITDGGR